MANSKISHIAVGGTTYDIVGGIPMATVDSTSTATAFTAQVPGVTSYYDGLTIYVFNNKVATASGITLNINSLGAKKIYRANADAELTSHWAVGTGYLLTYNSARNSNAGGWDWQTGYDSNSDSTCTGYVRNTYSTYAANGAIYDYMLCFQSSETQVIPANTVDGSTATTKTLNTASFLPYGVIGYYSSTTTIASGSAVPVGNFWFGYTLLDLRYSFNSGSTLTANKDVYIQCSVQSDGKLKFSGNACIKQALPTTADGYVYLLLGHAYDTYRIALYAYHPIFEFKNSALRLWTNPAATAQTVSLTGDVTGSGTSSIATTLSTSGVTAGSYGPSAGATLAHSGKFTVPYVTFDAKGRATGASSITYTLPASGNTDTKVTQAAAITTNGEYPVLLAYNTATTATTNTVNKTSTLKYNPSTGALSATKFLGDGSGLTGISAGPSPSSTTPKVNGTAAVGSETAYSRGDHVHPTDTTRVAKSGDTMTGKLVCQNNSHYEEKQARNIFIVISGSTLPTGANGDICLLY